VQDEKVAIKQLSSVLAAGGHLIWSAPFLEKYHRAPVDMRRYTNDSVVHLLHDEAGLCVRSIVRAGNEMLTTGYLLGMGSRDFTPTELRSEETAAAAEGDSASSSPSFSSVSSSSSSSLYYGVIALAQAPPCSVSLQ